MTENKNASNLRQWISHILQFLLGLMFLLGAVANLMGTEESVATGTEMGYPEGSLAYMGIVLGISALLYLIPKTNILGALLLTAWLGGAVATQVIHKDPVEDLLAPVLFGALIWGILLLRDRKLLQLLPLRKSE